MRDDDSPGLCRGEIFGQQAGPGRDGCRVVHAGVDQRPAALFFDRPQIDVVERKRQRHADPANAGCHLAGLPVLEGRQRVAQTVAIDFAGVLALEGLTVGREQRGIGDAIWRACRGDV